MRIESSIITSLSELRAIEQQRIADERAAIEAKRAAEIEARRAVEQARLDAIAAREQAEREERIRIEIARAEAEREARMRLEAAEAAERNRLAAQLEERRLAEELELRRAEVAKKRPTWMIAVTAIAGLAAVGLSWLAIDRSNEMARAEEARIIATREKDKAREDLLETQKRLDGLRGDVDRIDGNIARLTTQLESAKTAAEQKRVAQELAAQAEAKRVARLRIAEEEARKAKIERNKKIDVTECAKTALGCDLKVGR